MTEQKAKLEQLGHKAQLDQQDHKAQQVLLEIKDRKEILVLIVQ
jgi:hypothetical protein